MKTNKTNNTKLKRRGNPMVNPGKEQQFLSLIRNPPRHSYSQYVRHHYTQANTNNVYKTRLLLQTT